ncbi:hypothetical protein IFR04_004729 [Cadophora malorum]|uniref:Uncharacterized protein n=1 Tax=Cadophora malorum TaxID=108018 RepID=A0A8H7WC41_9HELO|nr:hypothetical protein IFR04_004729 [Cadophora malorum]
MEDKLPTQDVVVNAIDTSSIPAVAPSSRNESSPDILGRVAQHTPRTHHWSFSQPVTASLNGAGRPAREYAPSSRSSSPNDHYRGQQPTSARDAWQIIDSRPRNAISGTDYVERRLREVIGHEVNRLSTYLYTQTGGSAVEEDRQVMMDAERMIEQVHQDLRRVVDARMGSIIRPGWSGNTGTPAVAESNSREQWHPVRLASSDLFIPPNIPETPTDVNRDLPGSYSRLGPSSASTAQVVANIELPHHADRAATPPIRSAAPSPPAVAGHVRGRHSPPS